MKKIFLVFAMLFAFNASASDYQARYNMTAVFGKGEPATPAPPKEKCDADYNSSFWVSGTGSYRVFYIYWEGVKLIETGEYERTTADINGYRYTRKTSVANYGYYQKYTVCRIAI